MEIKTIKKQGYNIHLIKNKDFKTILVKTIFWEPLKKEELTIRSMLINILLFSSKKYPTGQELNMKKEDLYGLSIGGGNYRKGNYIFSEISMSIIEDKYTEKGLFKNSLEFYFEVLQNPNIINDEFKEEPYNIVYENIKSSIMSEKEDPTYYSILEYKRLLGKDKPFSISIEGKLSKLKKITKKNLYDYYKKFYKNNNKDIIIVGNIKIDETEKLLDSIIKTYPTPNHKKDLYVTYEKDYSDKVIESEFTQSKLIMGGTLKHLTYREKCYEALAYNVILGNSPNSKLFNNIREKHSYAYNIASSINRLDSIFYIHAGISKNHYEDTKKEILKEMEKMREGKFSNQDVKNAKQVILSILKEIHDYQGAIADHYFNYLYLGSESIKEQNEAVKNITKEGIVKVANKIKIDTMLLLKEK